MKIHSFGSVLLLINSNSSLNGEKEECRRYPLASDGKGPTTPDLGAQGSEGDIAPKAQVLSGGVTCGTLLREGSSVGF
jgi:hypothetical protein